MDILQPFIWSREHRRKCPHTPTKQQIDSAKRHIKKETSGKSSKINFGRRLFLTSRASWMWLLRNGTSKWTVDSGFSFLRTLVCHWGIGQRFTREKKKKKKMCTYTDSSETKDFVHLLFWISYSVSPMSISAPSVGLAGSRNAPLDAGGHVYVEKKACWRRKFLSKWE